MKNTLSKEDSVLKTKMQTQTVVHLLKMVHLPAQHSRLVKAQVKGEWNEGLALFESASEQLSKHTLMIEDGNV